MTAPSVVLVAVTKCLETFVTWFRAFIVDRIIDTVRRVEGKFEFFLFASVSQTRVTLKRPRYEHTLRFQSVEFDARANYFIGDPANVAKGRHAGTPESIVWRLFGKKHLNSRQQVIPKIRCFDRMLFH